MKYYSTPQLSYRVRGCLKVPISWVYEQSRQGNIPTHRIGRYIRFDLREVLANQKAKPYG